MEESCIGPAVSAFFTDITSNRLGRPIPFFRRFQTAFTSSTWPTSSIFGASFWRRNLSCSFVTQKQVCGPRTNISQPIWIKFCTHLLLYGIHLWADLDRDRRVGGSRPNQNDCFFPVILVTHPKSYIETTDRRNFGGKPSKWRRGRCIYAVVKNSGIL